VFAALKAKLEQIWDDVTGDARREVEQAVADLEAEIAKVQPVVTEFKAQLETAVAAAEPEVKAAVEALAGKLAADIAAVFASNM
jgi:F0F1-type ATP synthase membrane subunit b/b'